MGFQMHINMDMFLPICDHELFGTGIGFNSCGHFSSLLFGTGIGFNSCGPFSSLQLTWFTIFE